MLQYVGEQQSSEDCLSETRGGKLLPVMVWICGGGFHRGSAANPVFDGMRLTAGGVVVVSVNCRVGIFGFMAHPELTVELANLDRPKVFDALPSPFNGF